MYGCSSIDQADIIFVQHVVILKYQLYTQTAIILYLLIYLYFILSLLLSLLSYSNTMTGYGWLTQSALLPTKSKPIEVRDEGSLFALRAVLLKEKQKVSQVVQHKKMYKGQRQMKTNSGIEERNRKDEEAHSHRSTVRDCSKALQVKEKVYSQLSSSKKNIGQLLVDFSAKDEQDDEYDKQRVEFYKGKMEQLEMQRGDIHEECIGEGDMRERLAWERQVLSQLKGESQQREKVQQVFDKRLKGEQKQALEEFIKQFNEEEKMMLQVRKRRQQIQEERARKIKILNSLQESKAMEKERQRQADDQLQKGDVDVDVLKQKSISGNKVIDCEREVQ